MTERCGDLSFATRWALCHWIHDVQMPLIIGSFRNLCHWIGDVQVMHNHPISATPPCYRPAYIIYQGPPA